MKSFIMKIYLDDIRTEPDGWVSAKTAQEAIELLKSNNISKISLDHDLGDDKNGTGYDVILWIVRDQKYSPIWLKKIPPPWLKRIPPPLTTYSAYKVK